MLKQFKFDVILDEGDLCNRVAEKKRLLNIMDRSGRLVLYSPRRMGKTSLVNVCSKEHKKNIHDSFHLYVDLNEVESLSEVASRFQSHYEFALSEQVPLQKVKTYLGDLLSRLKVGLPGGFEVSLERAVREQAELYLMSFFKELEKMSHNKRVVLMIDEFQGVAEHRDAQAILRRALQSLAGVAVVLMGSNQRLLYKIFNDKNLPFFGFGEDMELEYIPVEDYLPYMNERFAANNVSISEGVAIYMMDLMNNIPNYINELGSWIADSMENMELTTQHIDVALDAAAQSKRGRYASALYGYTSNQKKTIKAVAHVGRADAMTGKEMQKLTGLSPTELSRAKNELEDSPLISRDIENRYFIPDPFLKKFLLMM